MQLLDLRTVVFLSGAIAGLMSVVIFFMHRDHQQSMQGLRQWAFAPLLIFLSTLILGLQGLIKPWISIVLANLVLCSGLIMYLSGTRRFYEEPAVHWPWVCLPVVGVLLYVWTAPFPDYIMRLIVVNAFLGLVQAHTAWVIWRHDSHSFAARFTLTVLSLMAVMSFARVATTPWLPADTTLFTPTPLQSFFVGAYAFSALSLTIGFVLLANERLRHQLQHLISHDTLTGALSRHTLFERAREDVERAQRSGRPLTVMMLDLDHFKEVNDRHGHLVGDQVLRDFALRAHDELRKIDRLGRFGGEEFIAILPDTDVAQASLVAERIRASQTAQTQLPHCTVSIGLATEAHVDPRQPAQTQLEGLIARADKALYQAKSTGRNRLSVAPSHEPQP